MAAVLGFRLLGQHRLSLATATTAATTEQDFAFDEFSLTPKAATSLTSTCSP